MRLYTIGFTHKGAREFFEALKGAGVKNPCCLLCSEASPEHCHRRLVAEALQRRWRGLEVIHL